MWPGSLLEVWLNINKTIQSGYVQEAKKSQEENKVMLKPCRSFQENLHNFLDEEPSHFSGIF